MWERTFHEGSVKKTTVFAADRLTDEQLAANRISFSDAFLGASEIGPGQVYNGWTYQQDQAEALIRQRPS